MDDSINLMDDESPIALGQHGQDYLVRLDRNGDPVAGMAQSRLADLDAKGGLFSRPETSLLSATNTPAAQTGNNPDQPGQVGSPSGSEQPGALTAAPAKPGSPLPPQFQWVNDPDKLSAFLQKFNAKYPLNPSNSPQDVQDIYANMKPPENNYSPPKDGDKDASTYWHNYMGFPDQYALNRGSVESSGNADAWRSGSQAAGLNQVRPIAAADVGFEFREKLPNTKDGYRLADEAAFRQAMSDPNFNSMVSAMYSRKAFNIENGDPFKTEAGYKQGVYGIKAGEAWEDKTNAYVKNMFPGQWSGKGNR